MLLLLHCHTSEKPMKLSVIVREANYLADIAVKCSEIPPSGQDDMGFQCGALLLRCPAARPRAHIKKALS
jgi:hypothetical protein